MTDSISRTSQNIVHSFGKLKIKYRSGTTYTGLTHDLCKSALQKYIRRGETYLAQQIIADADLTLMALEDLKSDSLLNVDVQGNNVYIYKSLYPDTDFKVGKAFLTNIANRLRVISVEDVGLGNPGIVSQTEALLKTWNKQRGPNNRQALLKLVYLLSESKHLRMLSDLKSVFLLPPYYWHNDSEKHKILHIHNILTEFLKKPNLTALSLDTLLKGFEVKLSIMDIDCFWYLSTYLMQGGNLTGIPSIINKCIRIINPSTWINQEITVLLQWFRTLKHAEQPLYLYQAILLLIHSKTVEHAVIPIAESEITNKIYQEIITGNIKEIPIYDYCIDKHTLKGQISGKTSLEIFAKDSSQVVREEIKYLVPAYRAIYMALKIILDHIDMTDEQIRCIHNEYKVKMENIIPIIPPIKQKIQIKLKLPSSLQKSSEPLPLHDSSSTSEMYYFDLIVRAQLNTGHAKTDVYFAKVLQPISHWHIGDRVVIKGPYIDDTAPKHAVLMNQWKKVIGLPYVLQMDVLYLIPDRWLNVLNVSGLGIRYRNIKKDTVYPFLCADSLITRDIPVRMHSSNYWPNTLIADFDAMPELKWMPVTSWTSITELERRDYVFYLLVRYLAGIGDLADRNFLRINGRIYGLDEDIVTKGGNKPPGYELKKNKAELVRTWIKKHETEIMKFLQELPMPFGLKIKDINTTLPNIDSVIELFNIS